MAQLDDKQAPESAGKSSPVGAVNEALTSSKGTPQGGANIHDNPQAHAAADALGAKAFAAGNDVFFGAGQHAPGTPQGDQLLAHELTHVEQTRGMAAPQPNNFRVSDPGDHEEHAARAGESGAAGQANTIYRDVTGGPAPAGGGAGPAAGNPPPASGGAAPAHGDAYATWKAAVTSSDRAAAVGQWTALPADQKARVATEGTDFVRSTILVMGKDSADVLKVAHVKLDDYVFNIFASADFAQFLPTMRAANLLMPFLVAPPQREVVPLSTAQRLKLWVDAAATVVEARAMFQKVYPNVNDVANPPIADASAVAWSLATIQRLYGILIQYLPIGHAQTLTGGFILTTAAFGWFEPNNFRVAMPNTPGATNASQDSAQFHHMTGGGASGANGNFTKPDGTAGPSSMVHYDTTALHEVGHGVGERMGGNAYALNPASYPGWTALTPQQWANELWTAPTGPIDATVPKEAQIDDEHAKDMFITEIQNGKGSYKYDRGWGKTDPSNDAMSKFVSARYANVPLFHWWDHFVGAGAAKDPSYYWDDPVARTRGDWSYGYLVRAEPKPFQKLKTEAFTKKVSWYGVSSPLEWFAEQYAHYYRTEKTGGGLIDPATKALLDKLDTESFAPTSADGKRGVVFGDGAKPDGDQVAANAKREPLFFPW